MYCGGYAIQIWQVLFLRAPSVEVDERNSTREKEVDVSHVSSLNPEQIHSWTVDFQSELNYRFFSDKRTECAFLKKY